MVILLGLLGFKNMCMEYLIMSIKVQSFVMTIGQLDNIVTARTDHTWQLYQCKEYSIL